MIESTPAPQSAGASQGTDLSGILGQLSPIELEQARRLADTLSVEESGSVAGFGNTIQEDIASFAGSILAQIRSGDSGDVGAAVTELIMTLQQSPSEEKPARSLMNLPLVGKWMAGAKRAAQQARTLEDQVESIRAQLDASYIMLQKDIQLLDIVLKRNYDYFKQLDLHIAAVQLRLEEAMTEERPRLQERAAEGSDPWADQRLREAEDFIRRLELRLDDFRRTRFISLSQAPRIRLLQQGEQLMMEKIQSVIYNLIPLWKMDLVTSSAQARISRAMDVHNQIKGEIEASMQRSAQRQRELTLHVASQSEQGMISMETMRTVHQELIATLEETMTIYDEGRKHRSEAEAELTEMERQLKSKLAATIGVSHTQRYA
ncbi:toxic anion resistance protein [Paenibacillus daejeonensis]|uniref:toxic anion resistance protein n=1 Tax=Paenibacillus daejeonensis TaxID=135193 RepID=UPI00035D99BA|nr:toxic anion resistance protein [Paenibacillus daejeonensis]